MPDRPRILSDDERIAWLRLARTESVGPSTFSTLVQGFDGIHAALEAAPRLARRGGKELKLYDAGRAERELEAAAELSGRIIASVEPDYPPLLAALDPPPPLITVLGNPELLQRESVAVVGARNASALGIKFAKNIASDLGRAGFAIVSGLARGIDRAAHEAALETGTVAVMAGGADNVYPPENAALYESIVEAGAVVCELPLGITPQARHFPRRNRIVSGMARGVVVVEAADRSGSLITAGYALEQGREVFAAPGSPLDPRAKGSNRLIRDGATLTESAEDVLAVLDPILAQGFRPTELADEATCCPSNEISLETTDDRLRDIVAEKLSPAPVEIDELVRQCAAPARHVLTILLELELAQRVRRHPGARISWR